MAEKPQKRIELYTHCANCNERRPPNQSPKDWERLEAGLTADGFQVWCKRCRMEILHFTPEDLQKMLGSRPRCDCCPGGKHVRPS